MDYETKYEIPIPSSKLVKGRQGKDLHEYCALWLLDKECYEDLKPEKMPFKTQVVIDYEKFDPKADIKDREKMWRMFPEIDAYYQKKVYVKDVNEGRIKHLEFFREHLPEDKKHLLTEKINEFKQALRGFYLAEGDPLAEEIAEEFQGTMFRG